MGKAKDIEETPKKRPAKPFKGVSSGVSFTKDNQPTSEAKKMGWQKLRSERHLTQAMVKKMLGKNGRPTKSFTKFMDSLVANANEGNPKAMDIIYKCLEDDIQKVEQTNLNYNVEMSKAEMKEINKQLEENY